MSTASGAGGFLDTMAVASRRRAESLRRAMPDVRARALASPPPVPLALADFDLVCEVKFAAPSAGSTPLRPPGAEAAAERARAYTDAGAAAISVLTEETRFGGSLAHLASAARAVPLPVLRKDFLVDPLQVHEARLHGASGVLLIARMLDDATLRAACAAARECGLFLLLEAFDAVDLERIGATLAAGHAVGITTLVGVNCRDLGTLSVDAARHAELAPLLPAGVPAVAESGVLVPADAARVARLGYRLALVGTSLMRSARPGELAAALLETGRAAAREREAVR